MKKTIDLSTSLKIEWRESEAGGVYHLYIAAPEGGVAVGAVVKKKNGLYFAGSTYRQWDDVEIFEAAKQFVEKQFINGFSRG